MHTKTQTFSLIGRHIVLHEPYCGYTEGVIVEKIGPARFGCYLKKPNNPLYMSRTVGHPTTVDFHRSEFALPPLPGMSASQLSFLTIMTVSSTPMNLTSERIVTMEKIYERWAFSESELANPAKCESHNELVAYVDLDDEFGGTDGQQVIVYRNGRASNRYADGTAGVPEALALLAEQEETLIHPSGEDTTTWRDVETDKTGIFIQFRT